MDGDALRKRTHHLRIKHYDTSPVCVFYWDYRKDDLDSTKENPWQKRKPTHWTTTEAEWLIHIRSPDPLAHTLFVRFPSLCD